MSNATASIESLREKHQVIQYHSKKIWVCNDHICGIDGVIAVR